MVQWREVKGRHPDALVLFRVGDFYEMFHSDAEEGARLLGLTLTSRNNGSSRAPLAGIPVHALEPYLQRLVRAGRRVAICEQVEDPREAKGIVRREVVEMVTPGAVFTDSLLDSRRNNFLVALSGEPAVGEVGIAAVDLTTGELILSLVPASELRDPLGRLDPSEVLLPTSWMGLRLDGAERAVGTHRADWIFEPEAGAEALRRHFGVLGLEGFGLGPGDGAMLGAAGAILTYLSEVQPGTRAQLRPPRVERGGSAMPLDEMTRRNLELVEPLRGSDARGTLLRVLDEALTPMGGRLLRRWLLAPLLSPDAIGARLDAVQSFVDDADLRREVRGTLGRVRDLERLAVKAAAGRIAPRELLALAGSLAHVPTLRAALEPTASELLRQHLDGLDPVDDVRSLVEAAIDPSAPAALGDGRCIRPGFDPELDAIRTARDGAVDFIARLQAHERQRTGISSLKVGFNKVFGYYLEITRANLDRVPGDYQRRQTLANAERYVTPELKEWEEKVLGAEERLAALEARIFADVRARVATEVPRVLGLSVAVAGIDVLGALAEVAVRRGYVRPVVDHGFELEIRGGRHPVVETMMPRETFIPNDVRLGSTGRTMILTGPNMAGKSTVLRQVGLIVLLAHVGSFVPATTARIGRVDRIFTRVGASDDLVRGQSTFMVEMTETAAILHGATDRSLVLLDEIGRGTSTWDGLSVATAVTEHLHERVGAKTIFATHYHELTELADRLPGVVNFSVAVREEGDEIVFLRRLVAGGADRSYGVEVARLAGIPPEVVARAREILGALESHDGAVTRPVPPPVRETQLALFGGLHPAVDRLKALSVERLTPLQGLNLLAELVELARNESKDP
jgi:DNA mismatch repair protein MutS